MCHKNSGLILIKGANFEFSASRIAFYGLCFSPYFGRERKQKMKVDFYTSLKLKLEDQSTWPNLYVFKFIVPADNEHVARVMELFSPEAEITSRESSKGKYISITGREVMIDAESVINRYKEAEKINGIIAL
jgi:putative lipoic acid-binding regulatory protein